MRAFRLPPLALLLGLASLPDASRAADPACAVKSRSERLVVLICPAQASTETLRAAGVAACKDRSVCNAWIWDDAAKAPAAAPETDKDLPKTATSAARAIWIHDAQQLMELRRAR